MKNLLWVILFLLFLGGGGYAVYRMTRGIRNNNPGNIRGSAVVKWKGEVGRDDKDFVVFDTSINGIRALARTLSTYYKKHGLTTIEQIINRWAPPSENDTASYIASVSERTGLPKDIPFLWSDDNVVLLTKAIIRHENGVNPYSDDTVVSGVKLA